MGVAYPPELPQAPQRGTFNQQNQPNTIRSSVDVGEAKVRRRYTYPIKKEQWALILTPEQLDIFLSWYENDLLSGVNRFDFEDTLTGILEEYRIASMPIYAPYGKCGGYLVNFNVEQLP